MSARQVPDHEDTSVGPELIRKTLTLTSLAILKVDIDERHLDYIDYLVSFVLSLLGKYKPEVVTDNQIAELLLQEFGLKVPIKAVQHVLRRMSRDKYLRKDHEAFFPAPKLPSVDIGLKREDAENRIQGVYDALRDFASTLQPGLAWTDSEAATAIIGFLSHFAVDCLRTYVFNTALPRVAEGSPSDLFIVSRFVQHLHQTDRARFEDFIVLVKGQMYANALTCPDLQSLEQKFDRVTFYLDTPVVLNLLGLQGKEAKQAAEELISLVSDLRGRLAVFEHTFQEIKGVINYSMDHLDDPTVTNRVLREVRSSGMGLSDLILCADQLRERLSILGVRVKPTPPYQHAVQIDEQVFQEALQDDLRYYSEHALLNDINSVRCIYVLRQEVWPARLEDAMAVLVTTNGAFARVAFEFGKTHNSTKEVSSVITDYSLANVAWLKAPMKRPELPEKETLALCYAAMEPTGDIFKKYIEMMDRLKNEGKISEEDHLILRLSRSAHRELMDLTLGDEEALTGAGLQEILRRVKESLVREEKARGAAERATFEKALNETTTILETTEKDRGRLEADKAAILLTASCRARSFSKPTTLLLMIIFSALLLLGAAAGSGLIGIRLVTSLPAKALIVCSVCIAVIWGWYSWITGRSVRTLTQQIEDRITMRVFGWLTGQPGIPGDRTKDT